MKKGFTVVELIVTMVIIALLGGIGIISYNYIFDTASDNYYKTIENSLLLSGNEYFEKNREELPIKGYNIVALENLESGNYVSPVKDKKGGTCEKGDVYVFRDSVTNTYDYEVCLKCLDYESDGKFCQGYVPGTINVSAKRVNTGIRYNPLLSYKNVEVINEGIQVELYLDKEDIAYYSIDKVNDHCVAVSKKCTITINDGGSYLVSAYNRNGEKVADDRVINVKIDKDAPTFEIKNENRYTITDGTDKKNVNIKLDNVKDDMGVSKIEYCLKKANETCSDSDYKTLASNVYNINEKLESGSYQLNVRVYDVVGNKTEKSSKFDVSYYITLKYDDGTTEQYEVVTGKPYGYLDKLPGIYNKKLIKWMYNGSEVTNNTVVTQKKTHMLTTEHTDKVNVTTNIYCDDITYNTKSQKITVAPPSGVTFVNNTGTNAGNYTVTAKILYGLAWSDGTTTDKTFVCNIKKKLPDMSLSKTSGIAIYETNETVTITTDSNGALSCTSSDQAVAKCSISGNTLTVIPQANSADNKTATITVSQAETANYLANSKTYSVTVNRKTLACPGSPADKTYNGADQNSGVTCPNGSTAGGDLKGKNANTYHHSCTANAGYKFSNTCSVSWKINRKNTTMSLNVTSGTLTYGTNGTVTITTDGDGALSCTSSDQSVAKCSVSGKTLTIIPQATTADGKKATITITQAAGTNYNGVSKTYTATVNRMTIACPGSPADKTYNGADQNSGVTCPSGSSAGGTTKAQNANTYYHNCTSNAGYKFSSSCSVSWKINPKAIGSCPTGATRTYNGGSQNSGVSCPTGSSATSGTTSATNVNSYSYTCTGSGNYTGSCSVSWKINPKAIGSCPTGSSATSGTTSATTANSYSYTCTGSGNYTGSCSVSWKINKATPTAPTLSNASFDKDGNSHCIGETGGTSGLTTEYRWRNVGGSWSAWSSDKTNTACGKEIGTWEIQARKAGNANYNTSSESNVATLTIKEECYRWTGCVRSCSGEREHLTTCHDPVTGNFDGMICGSPC